MGFVCCVPGCKTRSYSGRNDNGIQMHRFPNDPQLFNRWLSAIGRSDLTQKTHKKIRACYRVCSVHFGSEADQIGGRWQSRIKSDAVPTLFLSSSNEFHATHAESQNEPQHHNPNVAIKTPLGEQENDNNSESEIQSMTPLRGKSINVVSTQAQTISLDLSIQSKRIIFNIYSHLKNENDDFSENQILNRICELTKIRHDLVCKVISERCKWEKLT